MYITTYKICIVFFLRKNESVLLNYLAVEEIVVFNFADSSNSKS